MARIPIGSIAAASNSNGTRLKVVVIGEGGTVFDVNGRFGHDKPQRANLTNYLPLSDGKQTQGSLWTDGGIVDIAHANSKLAACTIEHLNLACFFYQLPDSSIVMRRCDVGCELKWETDYVPVLPTDNEYPAAFGTSIVVQPSVLRAGDNTNLTFFYQTTSGNIGIQKMTDSGELHGPLFLGRLSIPRCTPFTALTSGDEFIISYVTLDTQEIWECSGSLTSAPWREFEDEETYISAAQRLVLENSPTPDFAQMASYQTEHPIFYSMTSSPLKSIVWSSARARRAYHFECRGMPGTPIALCGRAPVWSSLTILFVDVNGAVNVGRLGSGSADGTKQPECFPIPLDSMRNAFTWALSKGADLALEVNTSSTTREITPTGFEMVTVDPIKGVSNCIGIVCEESLEGNVTSPEPCTQEVERNEIADLYEGDETDCSPAAECGRGKPTVYEAEDSPCCAPETVPRCVGEGKPCGEDESPCFEDQKPECCEADAPPECGDGPIHDENTISKFIPNGGDVDSSYGFCSTCDEDEVEDEGSELLADEECETVVGDVQDICNENIDQSQTCGEPDLDAAPFDAPTPSEASMTPTGLFDAPLPMLSLATPPALPVYDTPTASTDSSPVPFSSISDTPHLPELPRPAQEAPIIDTHRPFVDTIYDRLRFAFKPCGSQYISLQLPARRLDQVASMYMGTALTRSEFHSTEMSEVNFRLSDELFDVAKFVSGPNGKSLSQEYENLLYNLIPNPDTEVNRRLRTQREIIRKHMLERVDNGAPSRIPKSPTAASQVANVFSSEARQVVPLDKSTLINPESTALQICDLCTRLGHSNDMAQPICPNPPQSSTETGPPGRSTTRIDLLHHSTTAYIQNFPSFANITPVNESLSETHARALVHGRMHVAKELMAYLDVKTSSELLYDAKVKLRESGRSSMNTSGPTLPVTMKPADWYEASQTSWGADELNQDPVVFQTQLAQKLSDMDSLTAQLVPFIPSCTEDFEGLELEVQALIKERDSVQCALESEYPAEIIAAVHVQLPKAAGSSDYFTGLLGCAHTITSNDANGSALDSVAEQLEILKSIDRKLLGVTRSLAIKRARASMAKSDGPSMQLKSMLESKILEHQTFLEARMKFGQLSSERCALSLRSSIAQVHLPYSNDPRWTIISFSTEMPNTLWADSAVNFGLWAGCETDSVSPVETVKLDISFRVSLVQADRGNWFQSEFMKHSNQYMQLPGGERWAKWPSDVQAPEEVIDQIVQGKVGPKGNLPALPIGYLVAKDILIKIHAHERSGTTTKKNLVKQAATASGILCFGFAPQASAHGNAGAMHISEHSDGIVFRLPEAQILGYLMQLTPPDLSLEYNPDLVDSNLHMLLKKDTHIERASNQVETNVCNGGF
ncbi:unnamed protein product [Rhizoctonia solani]|uniref:Uncharacterized protein n=1 Tax=Rhizoctonia solani TaxID=456999 RepID=A0A8H3CSZ2_9AGAM|nr:unnamed protein product [Rhizoctonia solani]